MAKGTPYIIDVSAQVTARMLVYITDPADTGDEEETAYAFVHKVNDMLEERTEALTTQVQQTASLPDNKYVTYDLDIRPAMGAEVGGDDALDEGILRFDYCSCPEHEDLFGEQEDAA